MAKFHINPKTGTPGECSAVKGNCPFGGAEVHYETVQDARTAFELSMAGKELKTTKRSLSDDKSWGDWITYPSGAIIKAYGNTRGYIAKDTEIRFLAYGKNYHPTVGPSSYVSEEEAMASVAESFKEEKYALGDPFPVSLERELFTPYSHESYGLREHNGGTELAIIRADQIRYFSDLKAVERTQAYAELEDYYPNEERKGQPMKNNEVYWIDDVQGCFAYVEHNGAVFRGELKSKSDTNQSIEETV